MSLQKRLENVKSDFAKEASQEALDAFARATRELIDSGLAERALGEGAPMPRFSVRDTAGEVVNSIRIVAKGPTVLTFFRGRW